MKKLLIILLIPLLLISCANPFETYTYTVINNSTQSVTFILAKETDLVTLSPGEFADFRIACSAPRVDFAGNPKIAINRIGCTIEFKDMTKITTYVVNKTSLSVAISELNGMMPSLTIPANTLENAPVTTWSYSNSPVVAAISSSGFPVSVKTSLYNSCIYIVIGL